MNSNKSSKVYRITTGLEETESENEFTNWNKYVVIAQDASHAIEEAKKVFVFSKEYAFSVECIAEISQPLNAES